MKYKNIVVFFSGNGYQADYKDGETRFALHRYCCKTKKDAYEGAKQQVNFLNTQQEENNMTVYEYGFFNDTALDKEYYKKVYKKRGYKKVSVKRVKTDTKGLKMYEITLSR